MTPEKRQSLCLVLWCTDMNNCVVKSITGAVVEQVAGFKLTEYPPDGRGSMELDFEQKLLTYDRRGGFTLPLVSEDENNGVLQEDLLQVWLQRMKALGGPVLLERGKSGSSKDNDGEADGPTTTASAKPSFASDRRIIRLVIARIFADLLREKFLLEQQGE